MRPPRLMVLLACFVALPVLLTLVSLLRSHPQPQRGSFAASKSRKSGFRALFSFQTPSSLFPPSAIISLTDDNSTFFLARPAAFGPLLSSRGLSGRLWVGSGFGDDNTVRGGGAISGAEGELGCSDVPGWGDGSRKHDGTGSALQEHASHGGVGGGSKGRADAAHHQDGRRKRTEAHDKTPNDASSSSGGPSRDDGTDDYLHHPLSSSDVLRHSKPGQIAQKDSSDVANQPSHHADIQSLQEGAEIAGQIVLLSRGGCGFLEKVKWVQRRGGIALIVGDNTRGGGLVTMYAQGDTSNVTIPSLFTSHTTAHLLSSLIPADGSPDEGLPGKKAGSGAKDDRLSVKAGKSKGRGKKGKSSKSRPTFTPKGGPPKATAAPRAASKPGSAKIEVPAEVETPFQVKEKSSWLRSALSKIGIGHAGAPSGLGDDSRRPPSSGQLDWVLVDEWSDDDALAAGGALASSPRKPVAGEAADPSKGRKGTAKDEAPPHGDDFVIGVQDWRDPDLVGPAPAKDDAVSTKSTAKLPPGSLVQSQPYRPTSTPKAASKKPADTKEEKPIKSLEGGSITPGSGEYEQPESLAKGKVKGSPDKAGHGNADGSNADAPDSADRGWLDRLWAGKEGRPRPSAADLHVTKGGSDGTQHGATSPQAEEMELAEDDDDESEEDGEHAGLWVTLTPTTMSSSPFFDTLLVLVISPLVTLTVVYALLLVRSRIRRRRWRAPKSVVDRLPVRTYQTLSPASSTTSSSAPTPRSASPSTPLLQEHLTPGSRPRPRSRTASGVLVQSESPRSPVSGQERTTDDQPEGREKNRVRSPGWRRKYSGKQVECVVCLEEYVSGVSRVMSLPCGHEFHAECITPWLTTRRRTCPICKGDVVRSLAQGSSSTVDDAYHDDPEENVQRRAAESTNESPSAALPIQPTFDEEDGEDLERAEAPSLLRSRPWPFRWGGLSVLGLGNLRGFSASFGGESARRLAQEERDR
ncbi:MAG: hypothetical protein M1832_004603 [Thelocarpon impressellum]|nr:MAG: hypothetical protein M1832_004603 [Thelocarpon impressellum]